MNLQRLAAFALTALSAGVLGMTSETAAFPVAISLLAAVGMLGLVPLPLRAERRVIFGLLVAAVFALKYRYAPLDVRDLNSFPFYPLAHAAAQYMVTMQAANFFLHARRPLPTGFPFLTAMTLLAAGAVDATWSQQTAFFITAALYTAFSAVFFAASRRMADGPTHRSTGRVAWISAAMILALAGGAAFSGLVTVYRRQVNELLGELPLRLPRAPSTAQLPMEIELSSMDASAFRQARREIVLRVRSRHAPGYLRAQAFDTVSDSRWSNAADWATLSPNAIVPGLTDRAGSRVHAFRIRPRARLGQERITVWPMPGREVGLPAPMNAAVLAAPVDEMSVDEHHCALADDLPLGVDFSAQLADVPVSPISDAMRRRCLLLPPRLARTARPLAMVITAGCKTPAEKMDAVQRYFHEHYQYELGIQVPRRVDPLTWFLLRRPAAHCEYFAAGAAVLLRAVDVPTRYVTGYVAAERGAHGDYWLARRGDAHAWVEAYDPDRGWVLVEATPPAGQPSAADGRPHWLIAWWEHLRFQLQQLRVRLYKEGWRGLVGWLGDRLVDLGRWLVTTVEGGVALSAVALLAGLWARRKWKTRPRPTGPAPTPQLRALWRLRRRLDRRVRRLGLVRRDGETLHQFAHRLADADTDSPLASAAADWYRAYAATRYRGVTDEAIDDLRQSLPSPSRR